MDAEVRVRNHPCETAGEHTELRLEDMVVSKVGFNSAVRITSNNKNSAISKLVDHPDIRTDNNVRLMNVTEYGLPVCREEWYLSDVDLTTDHLRYVFD